MDLRWLKDKWVDLVNAANSRGIPLPMVRDPKTGRGDVALTLVVMSSFLVMVGLIGKWSGHLGGIDVANGLQFFYASSALYWARKLKSDGKGQVEIEGSEKKEDPQAPEDQQ